MITGIPDKTKLLLETLIEVQKGIKKNIDTIMILRVEIDLTKTTEKPKNIIILIEEMTEDIDLVTKSLKKTKTENI